MFAKKGREYHVCAAQISSSYVLPECSCMYTYDTSCLDANCAHSSVKSGRCSRCAGLESGMQLQRLCSSLRGHTVPRTLVQACHQAGILTQQQAAKQSRVQCAAWHGQALLFVECQLLACTCNAVPMLTSVRNTGLQHCLICQ